MELSKEFPPVDFSGRFDINEDNSFESYPLVCGRNWNELYSNVLRRKTKRDFWERDVTDSSPENVRDLIPSFTDGLDVFLYNWENLNYNDALRWNYHVLTPACRKSFPNTTVILTFQGSDSQAPSFWHKLLPNNTPFIDFRKIASPRPTRV